MLILNSLALVSPLYITNQEEWRRIYNKLKYTTNIKVVPSSSSSTIKASASLFYYDVHPRTLEVGLTLHEANATSTSVITNSTC